MSRSNTIKRLLVITGLLAVFVVMAYPLVWMINLSMRTGGESTIRFYREVWQAGPFDRYFLNSTIVVTLVLIGNILFCSMAGYAFARYRIPAGKILFFLVISTIMLPKQVILVPMYILMQKLHLLDTYAALTLPFLADPFNIFLIRQYLVSIPPDCEEAARLEGAGEFTVLFRVVMPVLKPALAVVAIHTSLINWNSFLFPFILTNSTSMRTLPVGLALLSQGQHSIDWGHMMAGAVISALPVVVAFLIFQRQIISGLTSGMTR
ncbi:MAG: ABC transporter permease subunit [Candidatus Latescibacteria bacterium]|nr:ABC transporter permease subunit [Candidatus Latescibacterota bacterium]NIM22220.1 ABC transporter permease subunit [Candidatus Latescibacterota bacterium]NIM66259.1 ABC transporter permease subunit [Candidatus Latescibacterota bacterium]NIO02336.1 ABC transporter permease subunit [Candidatus Latescibacterota bacterium]NIO29867.1 ABC transporter permease subunit [Candidatus Latescibacterota bacterium]